MDQRVYIIIPIVASQQYGLFLKKIADKNLPNVLFNPVHKQYV